MTPNSSILYQNPSNTVLLIDIPTSIALAQNLTQEPQSQSQPQVDLNITNTTTTCPMKRASRRRYLHSTEPRKEPYTTPPEPKTPAKRGKLLARIPPSERELYDELTPVLFDALADIKANFCSDAGSGNEWCLPRLSLPEPKAGENGNGPDSAASGRDAAGNTQKSQITQPKWVLSNLRPERRKRLTKPLEDREKKKKKSASVNRPSYNDGDDDQEEKDAQRQFHTAYFGLQNSQRGLGLSFDEYDKTQNLIQPPLVLAPGRNTFEDEGEITNTVVKNTSRETAIVEVRKFSVKAFRERGLSLDPDLDHDDNAGAGADALGVAQTQAQAEDQVFYIPPLATFILTTLPLSPSALLQEYGNPTPVPHLSPDQKFNLILLDPPWSNKSISRSGHYKTQSYSATELLTGYIFSVLAVHSYQPGFHTLGNDNGNEDKVGDQSDLSIAAIWTTNSVKSREAAYTALAHTGFVVVEQWIWIKITTDGRPLTPIDGLWRKPYEVLIIGQRKREDEFKSDRTIKRRVIAAVPDVHSRKPNLKEVFKRVFIARQAQTAATATAGGLMQYSALEVFARNLTAGWCAVGDEALKFNTEKWWVDDDGED
ncbi:MT-A70-domain-containing protein [Aspergillus filifer]